MQQREAVCPTEALALICGSGRRLVRSEMQLAAVLQATALQPCRLVVCHPALQQGPTPQTAVGLPARPVTELGLQSVRLILQMLQQVVTLHCLEKQKQQRDGRMRKGCQKLS